MTSSEESYNPALGYEPYWPGGEWVFNNPFNMTNGNGTTTTTEYLTVCGEPCEDQYRRIGKVCARHDSRQEVQNDQISKGDGDQRAQYLQLNPMNPMYDEHFQTVDNYCTFLDRQCKLLADNKLSESWMFIHVGPCIKNFEILVPRGDLPEYPPKRLDAYRVAADEYGYLFGKVNSTTTTKQP